MYLRLYDRLFLGDATEIESSPGFALEEFNALQAEVVALDINGTGVRVVILTVETSNDGDNWRLFPGGTLLIPSVGYYRTPVVMAVSASRARVKLELDDPSFSGLVSVGVNLSRQ